MRMPAKWKVQVREYSKVILGESLNERVSFGWSLLVPKGEFNVVFLLLRCSCIFLYYPHTHVAPHLVSG